MQSYSLTESAVLIDSTAYIPTGIGIPINVTIKSAMTTNLELIGKLGLHRLLTSREIKINGHLKPSAAITTHLTLSLTGLSSAGVGITTTTLTNTEVAGEITFSSSAGMRVKFDIPEEEQQLIKSHNQLFHITPSGQMEFGDDQSERKTCTNEKWRGTIGMDVCVGYSFPKPLTTLHKNANKLNSKISLPTGLLECDVTIRKSDSSIKYYDMAVKGLNKDNDIDEFKILMETPGSSTKRQTDIEVQWDSNKDTLKAYLKSPNTNAEIVGQFFNKNIKGTFADDEEKIVRRVEVVYKDLDSNRQHIHTASYHQNIVQGATSDFYGGKSDSAANLASVLIQSDYVAYSHNDPDNKLTYFKLNCSRTLDEDLIQTPDVILSEGYPYLIKYAGQVHMPEKLEVMFDGVTTKTESSNDFKFNSDYSTSKIKDQRLSLTKYIYYNRNNFEHNFKYVSNMESTQYPFLNYKISMESQLDTEANDGSLDKGLKSYDIKADYFADTNLWFNMSLSLINETALGHADNTDYEDSQVHQAKISVDFDSSAGRKILAEGEWKLDLGDGDDDENGQKYQSLSDEKDDEEDEADDEADDDSWKMIKSNANLDIWYDASQNPNNRMKAKLNFVTKGVEEFMFDGRFEKYPMLDNPTNNYNQVAVQPQNRKVHPKKQSKWNWWFGGNDGIDNNKTDNEELFAFYNLEYKKHSILNAYAKYDIGNGEKEAKIYIQNRQLDKDSWNISALAYTYSENEDYKSADGTTEAAQNFLRAYWFQSADVWDSEIEFVFDDKDDIDIWNGNSPAKDIALWLKGPDDFPEADSINLFSRFSWQKKDKEHDIGIIISTLTPFDNIKNLLIGFNVTKSKSSEIDGKGKINWNEFMTKLNIDGTFPSNKSVQVKVNATTNNADMKNIQLNLKIKYVDSQWLSDVDVIVSDTAKNEKRVDIKVILQMDPKFEIVLKMHSPNYHKLNIDIQYHAGVRHKALVSFSCHGISVYCKCTIPKNYFKQMLSSSNGMKSEKRSKWFLNYGSPSQKSQQMDAQEINLPLKFESDVKFEIMDSTIHYGLSVSDTLDEVSFFWHGIVSPVMPRPIIFDYTTKNVNNNIPNNLARIAETKLKIQLTHKTYLIEASNEIAKHRDEPSIFLVIFYPDRENLPKTYVKLSSSWNIIEQTISSTHFPYVVYNISTLITYKSDSATSQPMKANSRLVFNEANKLISLSSTVFYADKKSFKIGFDFEDVSRMHLTNLTWFFEIVKPDVRLDWHVDGYYAAGFQGFYDVKAVSTYLMDDGTERKINIGYMRDKSIGLEMGEFNVESSSFIYQVFLNTELPNLMAIITSKNMISKKEITSIINYNHEEKAFGIKFGKSILLRSVIATENRMLTDIYFNGKEGGDDDVNTESRLEFPVFSSVATLNNTRHLHIHMKWDPTVIDKMMKVIEESEQDLNNVILLSLKHFLEDIKAKLAKEGVISPASYYLPQSIAASIKHYAQQIYVSLLQHFEDNKSDKHQKQASSKFYKYGQTHNLHPATPILVMAKVFPDVYHEIRKLTQYTIHEATRRSFKYKIGFLWEELQDKIKNLFGKVNSVDDYFIYPIQDYLGELIDAIKERIFDFEKTYENGWKDNVLLQAFKSLSPDDSYNAYYNYYAKYIAQLALSQAPQILTLTGMNQHYSNFNEDNSRELYQNYDENNLNGPNENKKKPTHYKQNQVAQHYSSHEHQTTKDIACVRQTVSSLLTIIPMLAQFHLPRVTVYDDANGEIQVELTLPFRWQDFRHLPDMDEYIGIPAFIKIVKDLKSRIPDFFSIGDGAYAFYDYLVPDNYIHFEDTAFVVNGTKILTWDKELYDLGLFKCEYMLAKHVLGLVKLTATHRDHNLEVKITIRNRHVITINSNKVHMDGSLIELPTVKDNFEILVKPDEIIVHNMQDGYVFGYIISRNTLMFTVTPEHKNKYIGLFGTNNDDYKDDFTTSDGKNLYYDIAERLYTPEVEAFFNRFAKSWLIRGASANHQWYQTNNPKAEDGADVCTEKLIPNIRSGGDRNGKLMRKLFYWSRESLEQSALEFMSPSQILAENFVNENADILDDCDSNYKKDYLLDIFLAAQRHDGHRGVCALGHAISQECHFKNIPLELPAECCQCNYKQNSYHIDEPIANGEYEQKAQNQFKIDSNDEMSPSKKSVHVVYIVEEHKDLENMESTLKDLRKNLHDDLKSKLGISTSRIRYSLVGFGNMQLHPRRRYYAPANVSPSLLSPSTKLVTSKIEMSHDEMEKIWNNLKLSTSTHSDQADAVYMVAQEMSFTPYSIKLFVLVSPRPASHEKRVKEKLILEALRNQDIILHTLINCHIEPSKDVKGTVIGYSSGAYTSDQVNQDPIIGNHDIFKNSKIECKDTPAERLARHTNGFIFDAELLKNGKDSEKTSIAKIMPKVITQDISLPKRQTCICSENANNMERIECWNTNENDREPSSNHNGKRFWQHISSQPGRKDLPNQQYWWHAKHFNNQKSSNPKAHSWYESKLKKWAWKQQAAQDSMWNARNRWNYENHKNSTQGEKHQPHKWFWQWHNGKDENESPDSLKNRIDRSEHKPLSWSHSWQKFKNQIGHKYHEEKEWLKKVINGKTNKTVHPNNQKSKQHQDNAKQWSHRELAKPE